MSDDLLLARCPVESARTIEWLDRTDATRLPTSLLEIVHEYQHEVCVIDVVERLKLSMSTEETETIWSGTALSASLAHWTSVLVPMKMAHVEVAAFVCRDVRLGIDRNEHYWRNVSYRDADGNVSEHSELATRIITEWSRAGPIDIDGFQYNGTHRELQLYVGYHFDRNAIEDVARGALRDSTQLHRRRVICDSGAKRCAVHPVEESHDDTMERALVYVRGCEAARVDAVVTRYLQTLGISFDRLDVGDYRCSTTANLRTIHVPLEICFSLERGLRRHAADHNVDPIHIFCPATGKQYTRFSLSFLAVALWYLAALSLTCAAYGAWHSFAALSVRTILFCAATGVASIGCVFLFIYIVVWRRRAERRCARQRSNARLAMSGVSPGPR
jgi:hypothetical protein